MSTEYPWSDIADSAGEALMRRADERHPEHIFWGRDALGRPAMCIETEADGRSFLDIKGSAEIEVRREEITRATNRVWISLVQSKHEELFLKLCQDLLTSTRFEPDRAKRLRRMISRLAEWMELLGRAPRRGLSDRAIRGLFTELGVLASLVNSGLSWSKALRSWYGPSLAARDFKSPAVELEIKSHGERDRGKVRISSEWQLEPGAVRLFLITVALTESGDGISLGERVDAIANRIEEEELGARALFEDRIESAGYLRHDRYFVDRFVEANAVAHDVRDEFPSITSHDLPDGVSDVRYDLSLLAIAPFRGGLDEALAAFRESANGT